MHCKLWREAKTNFDTWVDAQVCLYKSYSDLQYQKFGNKSRKLLAKLCKGAHVPTHITSLKDAQGNTYSSPSDICSILEQFYTNLYSLDPSELNATQEFIQRVPLPHIDTALLAQPNSLITEQEIYKTISSFANGKPPAQMGSPLNSLNLQLTL